jgi:hypothetical protein
MASDLPSPWAARRRKELAELQAAITRHKAVMEEARAAGEEITITEEWGGTLFWKVPPHWVARAGAMMVQVGETGDDING